MAFDREYIWVTCLITGSLTQIEASNGTVVANGIQSGHLELPYDIAYDSVNDLLWVVNNGAGTVSRIKASDGTFAGPDITVGAQPLSITFDGANVWVVVSSTNELWIIQASDGSIVKQVSGINAFCLTFDGSHVWAGCFDNYVKMLDGTGNVLASYYAGSSPNDILFDGMNIWSANYNDNTASMINATNGTLLAAFPVGTNPRSLAFDGSSVWVLSIDNDSNVVLLKL
jgi:DNA-binding beta-propeller fold protein YncE